MPTKSERPQIRVHDQSTGEIVDRDMNDEELADYQATVAAAQTEMAPNVKTQEAKEALLLRLGLTVEEIQLLLS